MIDLVRNLTLNPTKPLAFPSYLEALKFHSIFGQISPETLPKFDQNRPSQMCLILGRKRLRSTSKSLLLPFSLFALKFRSIFGQNFFHNPQKLTARPHASPLFGSRRENIATCLTPYNYCLQLSLQLIINPLVTRVSV
ncbi:hypothetical protein L596_027371 [Steinernema carpocapsae]|uniref:Uncharacterized protein n=1 Tax=Steinernema carpocapsae TaxID=34508 RepID=A0A4U5M455_STECR|nr:hypothetical protein L596_027371 [Steinernema carpocapsae]